MTELEKGLELASKVPGVHCSGPYPTEAIENIADGDHLYVMEADGDIVFYLLRQNNKIVITSTLSIDKEDINDTLQEHINEWARNH